MLQNANTNTTSLSTLATLAGVNDTQTITAYNAAFETGKLVERRINRGTGSRGVVMTMEGTVNASVALWQTAKTARNDFDGRGWRGKFKLEAWE